MRKKPDDKKGINPKGKWTEIFTRRKKDISGHVEASEGRDHGEGWACTCGCNARVHGRKHREGPPKDMCDVGLKISTGGVSKAYRDNYERTFRHN